ncbi:hypothetical protein EVAR_46394_1 [Eumeta japonica]|uniref:Uncharacterized protein n=1 Tax=Eumeta variegata TaxID=151549 RepID=A0A4C1WYA6_EUMVA|nr:hypothetical protein EVAR_46394_1 [Eumeta japonica]
MSSDNPSLLIVARRVSGQLLQLGCEMLHNGGQVDGSTGADALRIVTLAQQPMNTADGEWKTGLIQTRLRLSLHFTIFTTAGHVEGDAPNELN